MYNNNTKVLSVELQTRKKQTNHTNQKIDKSNKIDKIDKRNKSNSLEKSLDQIFYLN